MTVKVTVISILDPAKRQRLASVNLATARVCIEAASDALDNDLDNGAIRHLHNAIKALHLALESIAFVSRNGGGKD